MAGALRETHGMKIVHLSLKPRLHEPMHFTSSLMLERGYGIVGDAQAIAGSPRQILLIDRPTLDRFDLTVGQLRENIVLSRISHPFQSGQVLQLGSEALVRLTTDCEPCALLNHIRPGLAQTIQTNRGFLGIVIKSGKIHIGDTAAIAPYQFPAIPETTRGKFEEFVARIPVGKVVSTTNLLLALGLTHSYYRSIPILLKKSPTHLPVHRIVSANGKLLTQHIPQQYNALHDEDVKVMDDQVSRNYFWEPIAFHELGEF
jgi:alkylated DNA nucleotide flippase Atl1